MALQFLHRVPVAISFTWPVRRRFCSSTVLSVCCLACLRRVRLLLRHRLATRVGEVEVVPPVHDPEPEESNKAKGPVVPPETVKANGISANVQRTSQNARLLSYFLASFGSAFLPASTSTFFSYWRAAFCSSCACARASLR